jgi:cellulose synthase/poly-beta-1,6-N-acetylglucosamine synthase-like glycosyltransferase
MGLGLAQRATSERLDTLAHGPAVPPLVLIQQESTCPELDCLRGWLNASTIAAAARRAEWVGTGADRVLVADGTIDDDIYVRVLANAVGVRFEPLDRVPRDACPMADEQLIQCCAGSSLWLTVAGDHELVVAPNGLHARNIIKALRDRPSLAKRLRLTTAAHLYEFVTRHADAAIGQRAACALAKSRPDLSAGPPRWRASLAVTLTTITAVLAVVIASPAVAFTTCGVVLTALFLAWTILRVAGLLLRPVHSARGRLRDRDLPVYTVLAPLYREAASLRGLVAAIRLLDYPREKLDVKLIVEADDHETCDVLATLSLPPWFEVIVAPNVGPRTKPKALNAALPFARGAYTVIYDAEDRPQPDQLRRAYAEFLARGRRLACVQASLTIDNTADNWLTAMFTAEYAGQFDVFLPGLARLGLPLPLGGSSNHFRTDVLREVGAWDPHNVTEDADLGMRLARFGYRSVAIAPPTYEEAPAQLGQWLRQRTRWFKGWMQTWLVHMRSPRRLCRELGSGGFVAAQLVVGGNVLASLVHPLLIGWLIAAPLIGASVWHGPVAAALFGTAMLGGYAASALLGVVGLMRRGVTRYSWVLLLMPLHWLLLSAAAWRALYQLLFDPYRWEKTEHGLARTSRVQRNDDIEKLLRELAAWSRRNTASRHGHGQR